MGNIYSILQSLIFTLAVTIWKTRTKNFFSGYKYLAFDKNLAKKIKNKKKEAGTLLSELNK